VIMVPIKHLNIAAIGNEDLVNGLRLAGISRYYVIKGDHDAREDVRKALTELINESDVGVIVMLEDYTEYVEELVTQVRKGRGITPIIIEVPSKFGTKYRNVREYYKTFIRESIGFDIEI